MKRSLGYAAAISLMACAAHAQDTYSFVFGGATFSSDLDAAGIIGGAPQTVDTDLDTGFQLGIGVEIGAQAKQRYDCSAGRGRT
ncbi:MAG: hypothetical protein AAFX07_14335 [Pseudomonadota bacterium]